MSTRPSLRIVAPIVAFGGGTGLGRLLSALSGIGERLTGVVTTTDDGGSTGRLRRDSDCIAWGDLRNCFNQICTEPTLGRLLFEHRFVEAGELSKHSLGNLILLALDQLTARPLDAVNLVRDLLEVKPRLIPMSEQPTTLTATTASGDAVVGEVAVDAMRELPRSIALDPAVEATPEVIEAIASAELVLLGPGSFITSVLPSLLVPGIRDALASASCPRVLLGNVLPEEGPMRDVTLARQIEWMDTVLGARLVDAVLWPKERPLAQHPDAVIVHEADVADDAERHDRIKVVCALGELLDALGERSS